MASKQTAPEGDPIEIFSARILVASGRKFCPTALVLFFANLNREQKEIEWEK